MFYVHTLWKALTEPSPAVTDHDERQRARLLTALVLLLVGVGAVALLSTFGLYSGTNIGEDPAYLLQFVLFAGLLVIYGVCRSRYYRVAAWIAVGMVWLGIFGGAMLSAGDGARGYITYLSIAVLLASMLLPQRGLLIFTGLSVGGILFLLVMAPYEARGEIFYSAIYMLMLSGVLIIFIRYRDRLEWQRQQRVTDSEQRNRAMLDALPDMMFRVSRSGYYIDFRANTTSELYLGDQSFIGRHVADILPQPAAAIILENIERTLETGALQVFDYTLPIQGADQVYEARMAVSGRDEVVYLVRNITERRQAADALRASEERWRTLVENLPGLVTHIDRDGTILFMNRVRFLRSVEERIGTPLSDLIPPEYRATVQQKIDSVIQTGKSTSYDVTVPNPAGGVAWYSVQIAPVWRDGEVDSLILISSDITERKLSEEALSASENRFRAMSDSAPYGIFMSDVNGDCMYTNRGFQQMVGVTPEEVLGKGWNQTVYPDDRGRLFKEWYDVVLHRQMRYETVCRFQNRDGTVLWCNIKAVAILDGEDLIGYVGTVEDITERKQADERLAHERNLLRTLIDAIPDFVYVKDRNSRYLLANTAHAKSIGCLPDDVVGKTDFNFFPVDLAEQYYADEQELFRTEQPLLNHEEVSVKDISDLTLMIASSTKVPLRDANGEIIGLVGVTRDITAGKQVEAQLEETRDQALQTARLKSEFLATMSHEIRTPMNGIIGMTELLLATDLNEEQQDYARIVLGEANTLLTIINDILDFSKIEAGKMMVESIELVVPDVIASVIDLVYPRAQEKALLLKTELEPDVPMIVRGDPVRLRQVLLNLIGNAIKFTRRGEVKISVSLERMEDGFITIRFAISDTGIGLSEVARKRLFQPFTQADGSTTRKYGGTGLGLMISKRLVELMDGEIGVESEEGVGSTFWFTVRFEESLQTVLPPDDSSTDEPASAATGDRADFLILVAEDNPTNQSLALKQLRNLGYRARLVNNGIEAVDEIVSHPGQYALVLMDCQMPMMDGYEATRLIRAEETNSDRHIPIVALTANAMPGTREKCLSAGMDDYMSKPVSLERLQAVLEQWLVKA